MSPTNVSTTLSAVNRNLVAAGLAVAAALLLAGTARAQDAAPKPSATPPPLPPTSPAPAGSASPPAPAMPPSATPPGASPPPYMYEEQWTPPAGAQPRSAPPPSETVPLPPGARPSGYPAPYVYEPPPPPATYHRAPLSSLWLGARAGVLFPFGSVYAGDYDPRGYAYGESWSGMASGGPSVETDLGFRLGRRYVVYGFWEHAFLGTGGDAGWRNNTALHLQGVSPFGEQSSANTDYVGLGFRWSANPDRSGFLVDLGLGYRWFKESWASGATISMQGFGELRAGIGADIRVNRVFSLSPLFAFSTGEFQDRQVTVPGGPSGSIASFAASHGTLTLTVGGHFDLVPSY